MKRTKKLHKCLAILGVLITGMGMLAPVTMAQLEIDRNTALDRSIESIEDKVGDTVVAEQGTDAVRTYITNLLEIMLPIAIALGVSVVFLGAYKIMSSQDTEKIKSGGKLILFGVIGIIIMVSAKFLSLTLVEDVIVGSQFVGLSIAENFYELLMMPLINVAMFLVVGILFFVLFFQAFQFLTGQDDGAKKKAAGMILRSVVGILVILSSNQLVESVFGSRERVFQGASNVGEVGTAIFENSSIPMLYEIINRIMGFAALVVLILIMFQTFMMLTKPDDPNMTKKIKNTLLYVAIGVVVIGAGYLITNVLLIN